MSLVISFIIRSNADLREMIAKGHSLEDFRKSVDGVHERYISYFNGESVFEPPEELEIFKLDHPVWICQPYVRPPPDVYLEKMRKIAAEEKKEREASTEDTKRSVEDDSTNSEEGPISKSKRKKLEKKAQKDKWKAINQEKIDYQACDSDSCNNPCSKKCSFLLCRRCCKTKSENEPVICEAHKIYVRSVEKKQILQENLSDSNIVLWYLTNTDIDIVQRTKIYFWLLNICRLNIIAAIWWDSPAAGR